MPCARFVSVSELLGDADQRYFSAGYRAVRQDLRGIRLYTDDHGAIRVGASLALSYPQSWSQKAGQEDRRPHLSTLDALLVASQLTEVILLEALSLPRELRQWVWIRRAVIRAGAKAVEELDDVEVRGQLISGDAELSPLFRHTRLVKTRFSIGALRVELDLIVPEARPCVPPAPTAPSTMRSASEPSTTTATASRPMTSASEMDGCWTRRRSTSRSSAGTRASTSTWARPTLAHRRS